jgi:hypothetical protein
MHGTKCEMHEMTRSRDYALDFHGLRAIGGIVLAISGPAQTAATSSVRS